MTEIKDGLEKIERALYIGLSLDARENLVDFNAIEEALEICEALRERIPAFPEKLLVAMQNRSPDMSGSWGYSHGDVSKLAIRQKRLNDFIGGQDENS